ncbi:calcium-binding protein [Microvirga ossetica]|uniref:calcium-binding protein n=1 Tax=Microvirga ossetica TaxID=1882682 RepID=UPI0013902F44|nr:calcium-binding protein [Microvirga ossetica]
MLNVDNPDGGSAVLIATNTGHILISKGRTITNGYDILQLMGHLGTVTNEGTLRTTSGDGAAIRFAVSAADHTVNNMGTIDAGGAGILFMQGGAHIVDNVGTITAGGLVISGNVDSDRVINAGTLRTTSAAPDAVLMDLGDGHDFYNGLMGRALGGTIKLGSGNDTAYGGVEAEIFAGGEGNDSIDGGAGNDTVNYSDATGGVSVDLSRTTSQAINGGQGSDTLIDIENVIGSAHNDTLVGSTGNNTLNGGGGTDTVRYTGSSAAKVDLRIQIAQPTGGYGSDMLIGITNLEGGSGADRFIGNEAHNRLVGGSGSDTLIGGGGNDTLDGGSGEDMAEFSGGRAEYKIVHNADGTVTVEHLLGNSENGTDTLKDIRLVKFADQTIALTNRAATNISLSSTSVSESTAVGASVADLYSSDPDADDLFYTLVSNAGGFFGLNSSNEIVLARALDYETAAEHAITVKVQDAYGGEFTKSFTITIRNVVETNPLVRTGTAKAETVTGESGNDRLFGLSGNDQLSGQIGNDTLTGGTGNDTLFGGDGKDVFVFDQKPAASNRDAVADFLPVDDVVHLSKKVFSKLSKGTLSSKAFLIGDHFKDKDDRVLYLKKAGALFYDPDGSGSAKAIQFASIGKNLKITHKDFFVI